MTPTQAGELRWPWWIRWPLALVVFVAIAAVVHVAAYGAAWIRCYSRPFHWVGRRLCEDPGALESGAIQWEPLYGMVAVGVGAVCFENWARLFYWCSWLGVLLVWMLIVAAAPPWPLVAQVMPPVLFAVALVPWTRSVERRIGFVVREA